MLIMLCRGKRMSWRAFRSLLASLALLSGAGSASAATLTVDGLGQLTGATGVDVGGTFYDVEFVEGTCIDVFSGCDNDLDLPFQDQPTLLASTIDLALLEQVLVDGPDGNFDSDPSLMRGCTNFLECVVATPIAAPGAPIVTTTFAQNRATGAGSDTFRNTNMDFDFDTELSPGLTAGNQFSASQLVWAVWTPVVVPEPSTALLMGLGIAGLSVRRGSN